MQSSEEINSHLIANSLEDDEIRKRVAIVVQAFLQVVQKKVESRYEGRWIPPRWEKGYGEMLGTEPKEEGEVQWGIGFYSTKSHGLTARGYIDGYVFCKITAHSIEEFPGLEEARVIFKSLNTFTQGVMNLFPGIEEEIALLKVPQRSL